MSELAGRETDTVPHHDLDTALQRLFAHAEAESRLVDPRTLRQLALEVVACCDRLAMAEAVDALDDPTDDAFARFMHGDGERVLIAFAS